MPLKIVPPRNSRTKNFYIRGSYLGVRVDATSGTSKRSVAIALLKRLEGEIERGEYPPRPAAPASDEPTFRGAALAYVEAGKSRRHIATLVKYFGDLSLADIDQAAIDKAAMTLHPNVSNATRNSSVYTPVSAILHRAGIKIQLKRPPGAKGRVINDWLPQADAFGIIVAAEAFDQEFATLLAFLLYTGPRIGGALNLQRADVNLIERQAWARPQKGQANNAVRLNEDLCERLKALLASHDRERVFRFHYGGHLKHQLTRAKLRYLGLPCPLRRPTGWREPPNRLEWVTFHIWRHTWATWMRQYGGVDTKGLVATGNWRDERSASRYAHADPRQEWAKVDCLPTPRKSGSEKV